MGSYGYFSIVSKVIQGVSGHWRDLPIAVIVRKKNVVLMRRGTLVRLGVSNTSNVLVTHLGALVTVVIWHVRKLHV